MPVAGGRVQIAFNDRMLEPDPAWFAIDGDLDPGLNVASYTIDRGRTYEFDRTDTGRATVVINDQNGILDPTNVDSPNHVRPLLQIQLWRWNPVDATWYSRFRGFIEELDYEFDPSQQVNRLTMACVDLFEILSVLEMFPGHFGDPPPARSAGQVFFEDTADGDHTGMQVRINQVLENAQIPPEMFFVFSGNVQLHEAVYSPGESAMTAIQEAADAEFPAVSNVYCDRNGMLTVHGRFARFSPEETAATVPGAWDFHDWKAGDGFEVDADEFNTAHIRAFNMNHGLSKIVNRALSYPLNAGDKAADDKIKDQVVEDTTSGPTNSITTYGIRPWSSENLLTKNGLVPGHVTSDEGWTETKRFASYYVSNYKTPHPRVSQITFRSIDPSSIGAAANWDLLCQCDIGDRVNVYISSPGGGGFSVAPDNQFFIEGIHEETRPANPDYDDITLSLDLSPGNYFQDNPWTAP